MDEEGAAVVIISFSSERDLNLMTAPPPRDIRGREWNRRTEWKDGRREEREGVRGEGLDITIHLHYFTLMHER